VEILSSSYRRSFFAEKGIFLATTRAGNVIGGGDWAEDRLIPDFVRAVLEDKPIIIRNSLATRPWQHVLEPLSGYLALGAELLKGNNDFATAWNFGPYDSDILNVCEIIGECINVWGRGSYELDKSFQPHEANSLKLDISKVKTELRWKPVENVYKAINNTILWYKKYYEGNSNMKEYTINQIEEYVLEAQRQGVSWSVN
jgi:CDP-glucose 4,6-dehydratase